MSDALRLEAAESEQRKPVIVRLAAHQFPRALSSALRTSATGKAAMIEDELQQTKPDPPALQMTPVSQAYAQSRVEIFGRGSKYAIFALHGRADAACVKEQKW
ncbi:hypothetical protein EVC45_30225 [Paraburkholderia sp. UYCP14C]|uniref:hypothetical protein n=1 Tax=Paraburkholderia sp. UYCP14C TaxID=2511130 RepID=UPI0010206B71|nr:hypothetical protein [Paraburkholderia sp. UYCP14C]RZF26116.1 hypothetical protein EVC45_30225 [Paraburkholderia sp. UYCP14C]